MADNASASYQDLGYDRIFVSLDGSEEQAKVLDRAITIAAATTPSSTLAMSSTPPRSRPPEPTRWTSFPLG